MVCTMRPPVSSNVVGSNWGVHGRDHNLGIACGNDCGVQSIQYRVPLLPSQLLRTWTKCCRRSESKQLRIMMMTMIMMLMLMLLSGSPGCCLCSSSLCLCLCLSDLLFDPPLALLELLFYAPLASASASQTYCAMLLWPFQIYCSMLLQPLPLPLRLIV